MKWRVLKITCVLVFTCAMFTSSFSQNYYLVVGAFSSESDQLKEFTTALPSFSRDTSYTVTTPNSLLHLYVFKSTNGAMTVPASINLPQGFQTQVASPPPASPETVSPTGTIKDDGVRLQPEVYANAASSKTDDATPAEGAAPPKPKSNFYKFMIASADGNLIPGEVHHVDFEQERELAAYTTDTFIDIPGPGGNQPMAMVCGIFGYKQVEKFVDFSNPVASAGAFRNEDGSWVIPYTLERLEKGDVSVMYNVSFYNDAVPMLPGSKKDLDELVAMMKENPNYVIKIHTHCNGKHTRKIMTLVNDNFFDTNGAPELEASAKTLTNLRADAVKQYLLNHGVSKDRIKTYGWGGTEMLVKQNAPHANLNDRVEIEILKD